MPLLSLLARGSGVVARSCTPHHRIAVIKEARDVGRDVGFAQTAERIVRYTFSVSFGVETACALVSNLGLGRSRKRV